MTKKILFSLSVILLVSSCSDRLYIAKRKYGKGYYVSVSPKTHKQTVPETAADKVKLAGKDQEVKTEVVYLYPEKAAIMNREPEAAVLAEAVDHSSTETVTGEKNSSEKVTASAAEVKTKRKFDFRPVFWGEDLFSVKPGDDPTVDLVVLIILAIFLPPLGVYLKDGKTTQKWFWITLIFCILGLMTGWFWIGYRSVFGLWWTLAAVFAVLHVLDYL